VTNMSEMFQYAQVFNQDIGGWDVSNVTNMIWMFSGRTAGTDGIIPNEFNQDISNWDVSNVTNMHGMFGRSLFDQNIGNWDVSNVTNMVSMFYENSNFNQDLSNWNVTYVTTCSNFSSLASSWTLPQPNFTNCNPN